MRRSVTLAVTLGLVALLGLMLGAAPPINPQPKKILIRFAHHMPEQPDSDEHVAAQTFKQIVESKSQGQIEVRVLPNNQIGNEGQGFEQVQNGIIEMDMLSEGTMPRFFKPGFLLGLPFLFPTSEVAWEVLDGPFGREYDEAFRKATGVRILGHGESGFRSLFNRTREVRTPKDMAGMKIRTMENPAHVAMMRGLGANPTPVSWTEVYSALQSGVVDGMENPPGLFYISKFYEQQKYLTVVKHLYSVHTLMINDRFFSGLSREHQDLVLEAGRAGTVAGRRTAVAAEDAAIENLKTKGIQVYFPTDAEYNEFRRLGQPGAEKYVREQVGDRWVDLILKAVADAEAKLEKK
ncbi:MAG: TRAP transporter substrate-binding protein [Candidatus Rokuibacteriota bacterium]